MKKVLICLARFCLSLSFLLLVLLTVTVAVGGVYVGFVLDTALDESMLSVAVTDRTTRLYYPNEEGAFQELTSDRISGSENALYCPLEQMPSYLKDAFIAIEDKRFYEHGGIDWIRTCFAVGNVLSGGQESFGGSTITQQLVKNLTGDNQRSIKRKLAELVRAAKLEERLSKEQILEQYLNVVNLSENCYGVRTAANAYFSKEPEALTLREAASIAAITNNPTRYNPIRFPENNRRRRDLILKQMRLQGRINEDEYLEAISEETALQIDENAFSGRVNSWFADLVVRDVIDALVRERGMSEATASRLVYGGGLKICTTVDPRLQKEMEDYYAESSHFPNHNDGKKAQSAAMIVDPHTGDILAVVGAVGEKSGNRVQSFATDTRRPSGSVIKPLSVYAPALERGMINWSTVFDDVPHSFRENGAPWPRNSPNLYRGLTNVNTALMHSVNTVSVSILSRLGAKNALRFLKDRLGMQSLSEENDCGAAALALGQQHNGVTLRELMGGYTALAGGGVYRETRSFTAVYDGNGTLILGNRDRHSRVLSKENAEIMTMMLRQAVQSGTGKAMTLKSVVDVAGKTGTSGNSCDKWFVGYTPELLAGVWYGYEYPESLSDVSGNPALTVFDDLMHRAVAIRGVEKRQFETSGDLIAVRYCKDSGGLMGEACRLDPRGDRSEIGYFKKGTEPTQYCDRHAKISYCTHGGVATEDCPPEECFTVGLVRVLRQFPRQIQVLDAPYTCYSLASKNGRELSCNEPYYAQYFDSNQFYGVAMGISPYNRICPMHSVTDEFWQRRWGGIGT